MKNLHLIPVNIFDLVEKLNDKSIRENEAMNYQLRLETIRDYITNSLNTHSRDKHPLMNTKKR